MVYVDTLVREWNHISCPTSYCHGFGLIVMGLDINILADNDDSNQYSMDFDCSNFQILVHAMCALSQNR